MYTPQVFERRALSFSSWMPVMNRNPLKNGNISFSRSAEESEKTGVAMKGALVEVLSVDRVSGTVLVEYTPPAESVLPAGEFLPAGALLRMSFADFNSHEFAQDGWPECGC